MTPQTQQLDLVLPPKPTIGKWPKSRQTMLWALCASLLRNERLTPLLALERYQCFSLSQRMGNLRSMGWTIQSEMIRLPNGKSVAQYWL